MRSFLAMALLFPHLLLPLVFSTPLFADEPGDCAILEADQKNERETPVPFKRWRFDERNVDAKVEQFLPPSYLQQLESRMGEKPRLSVSYSYEPGTNSLKSVDFAISSKYNKFMKFSFFRGTRSSSVIVERLTLKDPLNTDRDNLTVGQSGKGLPLDVFRYARDRMFALAKMGGYETVESVTQAHYLVMKLYDRSVGMDPTPETVGVYNYIEGLYKFARRELPEELRPKDINDFTEMLGTAFQEPSGLNIGRTKDVESYVKTGVFPPGTQVFKNAEGQPIAMSFPAADRLKSNVIFFRKKDDGSIVIMRWSDIVKQNLLVLSAKL